MNMVLPGENRVIFKYPFPVAGTDFFIQMPEGAEILHLDSQDSMSSVDPSVVMASTPTLWALVDPSLPYTNRHFLIYGTGHPIAADLSASLTYIGTWQMDGYVWHLWEKRMMEEG